MSGSGGKTSNYQQEVGEGGGVELATTAWNKTNLGEEGGEGGGGGATGFALCGAVPSKLSCFHSTTPLLIWDILMRSEAVHLQMKSSFCFLSTEFQCTTHNSQLSV